MSAAGAGEARRRAVAGPVRGADTHDARVVLHIGKGGVGKTTVSATTGIAAARAGHRTLVISADPAHSLGDVLGHHLGVDPVEIPGVPGLLAAQIDAITQFERGWAAIRDYLVRVLAARGVSDVQAEELLTVPGVEEIAVLLQVQRYAHTDGIDAVVVDCAPSAATLRLLALPETIRFYADKLVSTPIRLLRTVAASRSGDAPGDAVRDGVGELLTGLTRARTLLADRRTTSIRVVLTPESVVLAEARRLRTTLALHGFGPDAAVVNRVLPPEEAGPYLSDWATAQRAALAAVDESFGDLPIRHVPWARREPVGPEALAELARSAFPDDPLSVAGSSADIAVSRDDGGAYRMTVPLPCADRESVTLARSGDDLVITVDGHRRRLALPSLLRRCAVSGARFEGDLAGLDSTLAVTFVPDANAWPASLAGSLPEADATESATPAGAAAVAAVGE